MSRVGAAPRADAPAPSAPTRAATPVSHARAEASRRNGARSRGPKTEAGKSRSARNALRHGMRALNYVVLPDEDAVEFQALEAALVEELAPEGALQVVLARRVAVAAWRLARADRMEVELFEERRWEDAGVGMALLGRRVGERGPNPVPAAKRWQRHPQLRDAPALPRRRHGRILAGAAHPQGAPGRAGAGGAACSRARAQARAAAPTRAPREYRPSAPTERTRAPPRISI
jgi:hypothetical protein